MVARGAGFGAGVFEEPDCPDERPPHEPEFVRVPAGMFTMGTRQREPGHRDEEVQLEVTLTRDFWIQTTEVTQRAYAELMGEIPFAYFHAAECRGDYPVHSLNWLDALIYANARSRAESLPPCYDETTGAVVDGATPYDCEGYRLPTEAEWEYAARAGTTTSAWIGDLQGPWAGCEPDNGNRLGRIAWYCINAGSRLHPVARLEPNPWGLYDVLGNVAEWTWDLYGPYPGDVTDPTGASPDPAIETRRTLRGGSATDTWPDLRVGHRNDADPNRRSGEQGVRLVRTAW